jgi:hypothetical protein
MLVDATRAGLAEKDAAPIVRRELLPRLDSSGRLSPEPRLVDREPELRRIGAKKLSLDRHDPDEVLAIIRAAFRAWNLGRVRIPRALSRDLVLNRGVKARREIDRLVAV